MHKVLLPEACIIDALGRVKWKHTLLQSAFFLKSSEQLLQIVLSQETLWNAAGKEDGNWCEVQWRGQECSKWAPVGCQGRALCYGYLSLASFLGNCSTTVQANRLHNDTQAPRAVQLNDHLLKCRHLSSWTRKICLPYKNSVKQNMERSTGLPVCSEHFRNATFSLYSSQYWVPREGTGCQWDYFSGLRWKKHRNSHKEKQGRHFSVNCAENWTPACGCRDIGGLLLPGQALSWIIKAKLCLSK